MGLLQELLEKDDDYFEKKDTLNVLKTKLGRCARFYLWLKKKHVNEIAFINDIEEGQRIKKSMEKGFRNIRNDLEKTMISDINLIYEANKNTDKQQNQYARKLSMLMKKQKSDKSVNKKKKEVKIKLADMKKT